MDPLAYLSLLYSPPPRVPEVQRRGTSGATWAIRTSLQTATMPREKDPHLITLVLLTLTSFYYPSAEEGN
jgi:hypothetical protein